MTAEASPEEVVRHFYDCYNSRSDDLKTVCVPDYVDYGHTPPGHGRSGARDDYENAVKVASGVIHYDIDPLVVDADVVAPLRTGTLPNGDVARGLSVYRVSDGSSLDRERADLSDARIGLTSDTAVSHRSVGESGGIR
jgi:SnoaL-like protein